VPVATNNEYFQLVKNRYKVPDFFGTSSLSISVSVRMEKNLRNVICRRFEGGLGKIHLEYWIRENGSISKSWRFRNISSIYVTKSAEHSFGNCLVGTEKCGVHLYLLTRSGFSTLILSQFSRQFGGTCLLSVTN
jgi:hypothetical protein